MNEVGINYKYLKQFSRLLFNKPFSFKCLDPKYFPCVCKKQMPLESLRYFRYFEMVVGTND